MAERRYLLRTFGCQMNEHDSERIAGLLTADGYGNQEAADANVVVFNTCAIRENADNRLYGNLGHLRPLKQANPRCGSLSPGAWRRRTAARSASAPRGWTSSLARTLPGLLELLHRAENDGPQLDVREQTEIFPSACRLRDVAHHAWVSIAVGCDNACTFCIVPLVRGPQLSRPIGDVLAEVRGPRPPGRGRDHAARPEREHLRWPGPQRAGVGPAPAVRRPAPSGEPGGGAPPDPVHEPASPRLHARCDRCDGRERQGASTSTSRCSRGRTGAEGDAAFLPSRALPRLARTDPAVIPDIAVSTDIIVGFPGETEEDFEDTLDVVRRARFDQAYTFQYSPRPGTRAAEMDGQLDKPEVQERFDRLIALQEAIALERMREQVGSSAEVLVEGLGRKGGARDGRGATASCTSAGNTRPAPSSTCGS